MKLTFKNQVISGIALLIVGNAIVFVLHKGIFSNIAWIVYGLLFILHPVYPESFDLKKGTLVARIVGIICIAIGLLIQFVV